MEISPNTNCLRCIFVENNDTRDRDLKVKCKFYRNWQRCYLEVNFIRKEPKMKYRLKHILRRCLLLLFSGPVQLLIPAVPVNKHSKKIRALTSYVFWYYP